MGSSGGGGGGGAGMMALMNQGRPMPGLPIAGSGANIDPYDYGKFQNFLPDIKAEGQNDMATGLRPDMFTYRSPSGKVDPGMGDQIQGLRDQLAALQASSQQNQFGAGGGGGAGYGPPGSGLLPLPGQNWYGGPMASS